MTLANLWRSKGELDKAREIMLMLEGIAPDNPLLLFNLTALMLQMGKLQEARAYVKRIDTKGTDKEFKAKLRLLKKKLA